MPFVEGMRENRLRRASVELLTVSQFNRLCGRSVFQEVNGYSFAGFCIRDSTRSQPHDAKRFVACLHRNLPKHVEGSRDVLILDEMVAFWCSHPEVGGHEEY